MYLNLVDRLRPLTMALGLVKRYGPSSIKKYLWDKEFSEGYWNRIDHTPSDCVYPHVEKHLKNGAILDLGCGPGNTATELADTVYSTYVGVDISEAALAKATQRSQETGRAAKNRFANGDFLTYVPTQQFDVILMREAMYHIPGGQVSPLLRRYSQHLRDGGVFVVRMALSRKNGTPHPRLCAMIDIIEAEFDVVEKCEYGQPGPTVIVFRPRVATAKH